MMICWIQTTSLHDNVNYANKINNIIDKQLNISEILSIVSCISNYFQLF